MFCICLVKLHENFLSSSISSLYDNIAMCSCPIVVSLVEINEDNDGVAEHPDSMPVSAGSECVCDPVLSPRRCAVCYLLLPAAELLQGVIKVNNIVRVCACVVGYVFVCLYMFVWLVDWLVHLLFFCLSVCLSVCLEVCVGFWLVGW